MIKKFTGIFIRVLIFISYIGAAAGCSPSPVSSPTVEAVMPPTNTPAELPVLASTPTDSFAFLPTPEQTATPEITPTPNIDWCKTVNTRLSQKDEVRMDAPPEDEAFGAFVCLLEIIGTELSEYSAPAILVKIGLVDNTGVIHSYKAVIGGLIYKNPSAGDFKYPKCASQTTEYYTMEEYIAYLQTFINPVEPEEFPILLLTKAGLKYHWPPEANLINNDTSTHLQIKNALESGSGYPEPPENYQIFILPGVEVCK
ncbi:MAG: hypothetical protein GYA34_14020 [Chloroflexi bacterium]|nr:hypothetical protein [Chloroflexota bacterium]